MPQVRILGLHTVAAQQGQPGLTSRSCQARPALGRFADAIKAGRMVSCAWTAAHTRPARRRAQVCGRHQGRAHSQPGLISRSRQPQTLTPGPRGARRFADAIKAGRISKVEKIDDCCVLAAVGRQMASRKGVAATMFSALAKANINIRRARAPAGLAPRRRRAFGEAKQVACGMRSGLGGACAACVCKKGSIRG